MEQERFFEDEKRKNTPFIQNDADLIFAFSEPDAKDLDAEYKHINRDARMANTNDGDSFYLNQAYPLSRAADEMLGHNCNFSMMLKHDIKVCENTSVGRGAKGMNILVTRRQEQHARVYQDSGGFFRKEPKEEQQ